MQGRVDALVQFLPAPRPPACSKPETTPGSRARQASSDRAPAPGGVHALRLPNSSRTATSDNQASYALVRVPRPVARLCESIHWRGGRPLGEEDAAVRRGLG